MVFVEVRVEKTCTVTALFVRARTGTRTSSPYCYSVRDLVSQYVLVRVPIRVPTSTSVRTNVYVRDLKSVQRLHRFWGRYRLYSAAIRPMTSFRSWLTEERVCFTLRVREAGWLLTMPSNSLTIC